MTENPKENPYKTWSFLKQKLSKVNKTPIIHEGDIWWVSVGQNLGIEINGKGRLFSRPVIVFKKLSKQGFMGIPLTTQPHTGSWYVGFRFQNQQSYAALSQARVFSVTRLSTLLGQIAEDDMGRVKEGFEKLYLK